MLGYALLTLALIVAYYVHRRRENRNLPPGPPGLPLLGNAHQLGKDAPSTIATWKQRYGDTIFCHIGLQPFVILHDIHTIREVFGGESATGRGNQIDPVSNVPHSGIIFSEGELWKEQRRFAISSLKELGVGSSWIEDTIIAEVEDVRRTLDKKQGGLIDPNSLMALCAANVISALVFGKRFSHDDENFIRLVDLFAENLNIGGTDNDLLRAMPFLRYIPGPLRQRYLRSEKNRKNLMDFTQSLIDAHSKTGDVNDFIDAYQYEREVIKQKRVSGAPAAKSSLEDDTQMLISVLHLFMAGAETTSTTMTYAFIHMVNNSEVQRAVRKEIEQNIGSDQDVRMEHRNQLPYTEATILEVQRCANLGPLGVPHSVVSDMKIDGYDVPKGTMIISNVDSVLRDPRYWAEPTTFDPTRFLDSDGKVVRPNAFLVFGTGKRVCPGENLAKTELFLIFANIFRRFEVRNVPGKTVSDAKRLFGVVTRPLPYEVVFQRC